MRLLTHNSLRNNSKEAKGKGFPLVITSVEEVRVDDEIQQSHIDQEKRQKFVKRILPTLHWDALVLVRNNSGCMNLNHM